MDPKALLGRVVLLLLVSVSGEAALKAELLPAQFGSWSARDAKTFQVGTTGTHEGTILAEYGGTWIEQKTYGKAGEALVVTLTQFKDPSGAYGAFTYFRLPRGASAEIGDYSGTAGNRILFVVGNLLIEARGSPTGTRDLPLLAQSLRSAADHRPYPNLPSRLPEKGLEAGSDCYLLGPRALARFVPLGAGDWLGFEMGAEAEVAQYHRAGEHARLLIVEYPTPQIAHNRLAEISRWFRVNPKEGGGKGVALYAKRAGSLLGLVTEASSASYAQELLDAIRYEVKVTWSERESKLREPAFAELIYSIFILTGIILLMALGVGLGFGGFRLVMKHFFPRRFFDRPERMEIIQLGLSRKTESLYDE